MKFLSTLVFAALSLNLTAATPSEYKTTVECQLKNGRFLVQQAQGQDSYQLVVESPELAEEMYEDLVQTELLSFAGKDLRFTDGTLTVSGLRKSEAFHPRDYFPVFITKDILSQKSLLWDKLPVRDREFRRVFLSKCVGF